MKKLSMALVAVALMASGSMYAADVAAQQPVIHEAESFFTWNNARKAVTTLAALYCAYKAYYANQVQVAQARWEEIVELAKEGKANDQEVDAVLKNLYAVMYSNGMYQGEEGDFRQMDKIEDTLMEIRAAHASTPAEAQIVRDIHFADKHDRTKNQAVEKAKQDKNMEELAKTYGVDISQLKNGEFNKLSLNNAMAAIGSALRTGAAITANSLARFTK